MKNQLCAIVGASLLLLAIRWGTAAPKKVVGLTKFDFHFLKAINEFNNSECAYAPTVMKRASSPQIKQFAQQMVRQHTQINKELIVLAKKKGVKLTHYVPDEEQTIINRIGQLQGGAFDAAYRNEMVRDHTKGINAMERQVSLGTDSQIRAYAAKYLPLLRRHLQIVQGVDVTVGSGAGRQVFGASTSTAITPTSTPKGQ